MRRPDRDLASGITAAALALLLPIGIRAAAAPDDAKDKTSARFMVSGQILDPDGRPVSGAKVHVGPLADENAMQKPGAVTGADGRFTLSIARSELRPMPNQVDPGRLIQVIAEAVGFGPMWSDPIEATSDRPVVLRLARDDVPIEGTIADLEGRPLAGVKVYPVTLYAGIPTGLDAFIEAYRDNPFSHHTIQNNRVLRTLPIKPPSWPSELTTDEQGRFRLTGVGRERLVAMGIQGPTIENLVIYAMSRRDVNLKRTDRSSPYFRSLYEAGANMPIIYGSRFHHLGNPSRPIVGNVSERDTGRPIVGMDVLGVVANHETHANARTDAQGRFRLLGLPIEGKLRISVFPGKGQPYLRQQAEHRLRGSEEAPVRVDVKVSRGVLLRGRLIDAATRQPVQGSVAYMAKSRNPNLVKFPELGADTPSVDTGLDGSFELVGLSGPGALGARASEDRFCMSRPEQWGEPADKQGLFPTANLGLVDCIWFHTVASIDPKPDTTEVSRDIALEPGLSIQGKLVDPDGRAVEGVSATRLTALGFESHLVGSSFTAAGLETNRPRSIWFLNDRRTLGRMVTLSGQERGPITVTLQPCGTLVGRLLDAEGRPKPDARVTVVIRVKPFPFGHGNIKTDAEGRFRTTGLIPGLQYGLIGGTGTALQEGVAVRIGEVKDLGDLKD